LPGFSGEWEEKKLGELFVLKNGFAFASQFFSSSGPIVLTPGNFRLDGGLYFNARNTHRYAGDYAPTHVLNKGDLLIVMTDLTPDCNLLGKPAFLISPETVLHNQRIGKVVQHSNASIPEYLYLLLLSRPYLDRIKDTATGSTVRHTSVNSIYCVSVHLPALSEQTAIAAVLSEMDSEISALEQKLSKTRAIKQGMVQELLTGRIRLV
jgi:type I restriction enzyme S subunit